MVYKAKGYMLRSPKLGRRCLFRWCHDHNWNFREKSRKPTQHRLNMKTDSGSNVSYTEPLRFFHVR